MFAKILIFEYSRLLVYKKTRFLALAPGIGSILKLFDALKIYFLGLDRCATGIEAFFKSPFSKPWLLFVKDQVSISRK